jgi:hypothetical protein
MRRASNYEERGKQPHGGGGGGVKHCDCKYCKRPPCSTACDITNGAKEGEVSHHVDGRRYRAGGTMRYVLCE